MNKSVIAVWQIPLDVVGDRLDACRDLLSEEERGRAERFRFDWLSRRYTVAHGAMRAILARHTGVPARELRFQTTPYGKPFLDPSFNTHFNLAHSGELAILAIGVSELGADVEFIRPLDDFENIATGFFGAQEVAELHRYPEPERLRAFYRCWTRKEAYVKAIGEGLSISLSSFVVSLAEHEAALLKTSPPERAMEWKITALDLGSEYVGAVAVRGSTGKVENRWWGNCELAMQPDNREDEAKGEPFGNKEKGGCS